MIHPTPVIIQRDQALGCGPTCVQMILSGEGRLAGETQESLTRVILNASQPANAADHGAHWKSHPEALAQTLNSALEGEDGYEVLELPKSQRPEFFRRIYEWAGKGRVIVAANQGNHYIVLHGWHWSRKTEPQPSALAVRDPSRFDQLPGNVNLETNKNRFDGWIRESDFSETVVQPVDMPDCARWHNHFVAVVPKREARGHRWTQTGDGPPIQGERAALERAVSSMSQVSAAQRQRFLRDDRSVLKVSLLEGKDEPDYLCLAKTGKILEWFLVDGANGVVASGAAPVPARWPRVLDAQAAENTLRIWLAKSDSTTDIALTSIRRPLFYPLGPPKDTTTAGSSELGLYFCFSSAGQRWYVDTNGVVHAQHKSAKAATAV